MKDAGKKDGGRVEPDVENCVERNAKQNALNPKGYMALVERLTITAVLKSVGGCRTHAAEFLGISVRGLRLKIRQYQAQGFDISPAPPAASPVPNSSGTQDKKQAAKPRRKRI